MSDPMQSVRLVQRRDYQFDVHFGEGLPPLLADEPAPPSWRCPRFRRAT